MDDDSKMRQGLRRLVGEGEHGSISVTAMVKESGGVKYRTVKGNTKPKLAKGEELRYRALTRVRKDGRLRQVTKYGTTEEDARTALEQYLETRRPQSGSLNESSTLSDVLRHAPVVDLPQGPQEALRAVLTALGAQYGSLSMVDLSAALVDVLDVDLTASQAMHLPSALAAVLSAMVEG